MRLGAMMPSNIPTLLHTLRGGIFGLWKYCLVRGTMATSCFLLANINVHTTNRNQDSALVHLTRQYLTALFYSYSFAVNCEQNVSTEEVKRF